MYFGKVKNGIHNEWGFTGTENDPIFESLVEITDEEFNRLLEEANKNHKEIKGDEEGKPILVDYPEPTDKEKANARISELEHFLDETDWYAIRFADTGEPIPAEIKTKRQEARKEISELRGKVMS